MTELDVDALFARGLVDAYWAYHRRNDDREQRMSRTGNMWAWEAVAGLTSAQHPRAVEVIERLAEHVRGDAGDLAYLGAGPVEDLLRHHGPPTPALVAALDAAAQRNPSIALAVRCVWWSDGDDPALVARFTRFGDPY